MKKLTYVGVVVLFVCGVMGGTMLFFSIIAPAPAHAEAEREQWTVVAEETSAAPASDDFNTCALDNTRWSVRDPKGDSTIQVNGEQLLISVPANSDHDLFTNKNFAPRILQDVSNTDFSVEVKFQSVPSSRFQLQGIIVEQDTENYLRMEYYHDGNSLHVFAAFFQADAINVEADTIITAPATGDLYMRLSRSGNSWTQEYAVAAGDWQTNASFEFPLQVVQAGLYGGNADPDAGGEDTSPAYTAVVDYFFNSASPIAPEDGSSQSLATSVSGEGAIVKNPDQTTYTCDEPIQLTAVPATGWYFSGWTGMSVNNDNPLTVTLGQGSAITATFAPQQSSIYLPLIVR